MSLSLYDGPARSIDIRRVGIDRFLSTRTLCAAAAAQLSTWEGRAAWLNWVRLSRSYTHSRMCTCGIYFVSLRCCLLRPWCCCRCRRHQAEQSHLGYIGKAMPLTKNCTLYLSICISHSVRSIRLFRLFFLVSFSWPPICRVALLLISCSSFSQKEPLVMWKLIRSIAFAMPFGGRAWSNTNALTIIIKTAFWLCLL